MKKKILSQMMILSFAFAGLFLVGNNVFGGDPSTIITEPGDSSWEKNCDPVWTNDNCKVGSTTHTYMRPKAK